MTAPLKAASLSIQDGCYVVTINPDAADILNIKWRETDFANGLNARDYIAALRKDLDASYADACGL